MAHEAEATTADPYEEVLYPGFPFMQTHPDRLFLVGVLHGLDPAPPESCRVLEIGCGDGINLVGMAASLPGMTALGIDRAGGPLERGRRYASALGLNVELRALDLLQADERLGHFDYVIAHGVYAWVPEPVREALLAVAGRALAPQGIAFVSYNALPGGHVRRAMRDMLRFHARDAAAPAERVTRAREITAFARRWDGRSDGYGQALLHELGRMDQLSDHSLVHDDLGEVWEPVTLAGFAERAGAHGMRYFADAELDEMRFDRYPAGVDDGLLELAPDDLVAREQYGDFISGRAFRQSLLCRADAPPSVGPVPDGLARLHVSSSHAPDPLPAGGYASTLDRACAALAGRRGATLRELAQETGSGEEELAPALLSGFRRGLVQLRARPPRWATELPARPRTWTLARLMAAEGSGVMTSLDHDAVRSSDPFFLRAVSLLDGTRDFAGLLEALLASVGREIVVEVEGKPIEDVEPLREPFTERLAEVLRELLDAHLILDEEAQ
jgi:SAM-dependent methyltransferase